MKVYIVLCVGALVTFVETAVQRTVLVSCKGGICPKGQETYLDRDQYSLPRCRCVKPLTLFEKAEDNGGGCDAHVDACKQGAIESCSKITGERCYTLGGFYGFVKSSSVAGPARRLLKLGMTDHSFELDAFGDGCIEKPICQAEKIVELCDQRYITFAKRCTEARQALATKNEKNCIQAQKQCLSEASFKNSCYTLLKKCDAATIVQHCNDYGRHGNIPEDTCNEYRVKVGAETLPAELSPSERASDAECQRMRALCVGNSYGNCNMLVDQCDKLYINDICDAGKYKDIHRCNLAKAVTKGPSYYCDSYLKNCSFKGEEKDCNLALRYCDNKTIYLECKKNNIKTGSLCIGFRKLLIPLKYTKGLCNQFLSDCRMKYNSMACKEVLSHCGKDDIKSICQEPNLWTASMCQTARY